MPEENQNNEQVVDNTEQQTQEATSNEFSLLDESNPDTKESPVFESGVKPDDLPDELWDDESKSIKTEDLYNQWKQAEDRVKGLRGKLSRGEGKPPKDIEGYKLELSDEEAEQLSDVITDDDPVVNKLKEVCFNHKVSNDAFQGIVKDISLYLKDNAEGIAAGENLSEEQREAIKQEEYKKIGPNAPAVIRAVTEWGRTLKEQGSFSENDINTLVSFGKTGDGIRVLNTLRQLTGGNQIPVEAQVSDGLPSDSEIFDMMKSEKYMSGDASTHKKVDDLLQRRQQVGRPERLAI